MIKPKVGQYWKWTYNDGEFYGLIIDVDGPDIQGDYKVLLSVEQGSQYYKNWPNCEYNSITTEWIESDDLFAIYLPAYGTPLWRALNE